MKYLLITLLLTLLLPAAHACGQEIPSVDRSGTDVPYEPAAAYGRTARKEKPAYKQTVYWKRHITQNVLGAASLVVGTALWFPSIGASVAAGECNTLTTAGIIGGGCFVLASIPLFISAHHNKVKAHRVSLGADCITAPVVVGSNRREVQPALALRFNF